MKKRNSSILWGIIIITIGVILLGNAFNIWKVEIFFDGWWSLFIIIPSFIGLFERNGFVASFIGLVIGVLLLLGAQSIIDWSMVGKIFIPVLLIIIGLSFIFKPKIPNNIKEKNRDGKRPEFTAIFSGTETKVSEKLEGASCVAVFGGIDLDLRKAKIKDDIIIDCVSVFGGIDLMIPENVNIKFSGVPLFGGLDDKSNNEYDENNPTIYINYVCIFGGVDIK